MNARKELFMKKYILFVPFVLLVMGLSSCDDGRIYENASFVPREGRVLKLSGKISGISKWPEGYSIVVAGFDDESEYAIVSKVIPSPDTDGGEVEVILSGIGEDVTEVELCVINRLRKRVFSFHTIDNFTATVDTTLMEVGTIDVGMYHTIQQQVFNKTCTACHGGSTHPAADLNLLEGKSYADLVNQPSTIVNDVQRVKPHNAKESILYQILDTDISSGWNIDHSQMITSSSTLALINDWIDNGAQE